MAGKWDKLKTRFERATLDGNPTYQAKVNAVKETYTEHNFQALLVRYDELRTAKDEHEDAIKELNAELEAVGQLLIARFEEQDLHSVKTDAGKSFSVSVKPYPSVFDPQALEAHIAEHPELEYLYKVHPSSLAALVSDMLESGRDDEIPPGVRIFLKSSISVRKA